MKWIVRLGLYAAIAAIPFELPRRQTLPVEITTLASALFLATALCQPRRSFGRVPGPVWAFMGYLFCLALSASVNFLNDAGEVLHLFLLIFQGALVCWAAANLLEDESVTKGALLALAGACLLRSALPLVGVGRTATAVWTGGERLTAFGQNENNAAMFLSAGMLALLGLGYAGTRARIRPRWLVLPGCALIAYASIETGSRGGLLALLAGVATLALSHGQSVQRRLKSGVLALVGLAAVVVVASQTPVMRNRLRETAQEGKLAGREELYPLLGQMFLEKPLLGWGPENNQYELSLREENRRLIKRDAHNIVLEALTATGLLGAVAFCTGLGLCFRAAWRARAGPEGILPLALLVCVLMSNMSGNWISSKLLWFLFAYAVASARRTAAPDRAQDPRLCNASATRGQQRAPHLARNHHGPGELAERRSTYGSCRGIAAHP